MITIAIIAGATTLAAGIALMAIEGLRPRSRRTTNCMTLEELEDDA